MEVPRIRALRASVLPAAVLLLAACGGNGGETTKVEEQEWSVVPDSTSVEAGEVTFEVENTGDETHEFVILKTDLGPLDLPTADDGSVDEEGSDEIELVDEIEDIASGDSGEVTVDLESGSYVLLCNIVEEEEGGEVESHFQNGMRTEFTVE